MGREELKGKLHHLLDDFFEKLDDLEQNKDRLSADAKEEYHELIEKLNAKKNEVEEKLKNTGERTGSSMNHLRVAFQESFDSFKKAIENIQSDFSK